MCCLLQNPVAWLLDCEAWVPVERCLGVLPLRKNIQRFVAVPRSYGVCKWGFDVLRKVVQEGVRKWLVIYRHGHKYGKHRTGNTMILKPQFGRHASRVMGHNPSQFPKNFVSHKSQRGRPNGLEMWSQKGPKSGFLPTFYILYVLFF